MTTHRLPALIRVLFASVVAIATMVAVDAPLRITCVGDSITWGSKMNERETMCYPIRLQGLYAGGAVVTNCGIPGAQVTSYKTTAGYATALASAPQVVVIMLGTNDGKVAAWDAYQATFDQALNTLIDDFTALPSKPAIWLVTPPPVVKPGSFGISEEVLTAHVLPSLQRIAKARSLPLIDVRAPLAPHPEWIPDRVHPNGEAAALIANTVHAALTAPPKPRTIKD